jgi:hypothetical protein
LPFPRSENFISISWKIRIAGKSGSSLLETLNWAVLKSKMVRTLNLRRIDFLSVNCFHFHHYGVYRFRFHRRAFHVSGGLGAGKYSVWRQALWLTVNLVILLHV